MENIIFIKDRKVRVKPLRMLCMVDGDILYVSYIYYYMYSPYTVLLISYLPRGYLYM